jgi:hypothetical protein
MDLSSSKDWDTFCSGWKLYSGRERERRKLREQQQECKLGTCPGLVTLLLMIDDGQGSALLLAVVVAHVAVGSARKKRLRMSWNQG